MKTNQPQGYVKPQKLPCASSSSGWNHPSPKSWLSSQNPDLPPKIPIPPRLIPAPAPPGPLRERLLPAASGAAAPGALRDALGSIGKGIFLSMQTQGLVFSIFHTKKKINQSFKFCSSKEIGRKGFKLISAEQLRGSMVSKWTFGIAGSGTGRTMKTQEKKAKIKGWTPPAVILPQESTSLERKKCCP